MQRLSQHSQELFQGVANLKNHMPGLALENNVRRLLTHLLGIRKVGASMNSYDINPYEIIQ